MILNGAVIKKRRIEYNMTQNQLAHGICKQATISNIEKKNTANSMEIISAICARLDLEISDVLVNSYAPAVKENLKKITKLIEVRKFAEAEELLKKIIIMEDKLDDRELQELYLQRGTLDFLSNKNPETILFYLYKSLDFGAESNQVLFILANSILGAYYSDRGLTEQAESIFSKTIKLLKEYEKEDDRNPRLALTYYNIANFYSKNKNYTEALEYCNNGLKICAKYSSLVGLDYLLYEKAYNTMALKRANARDEYIVALGISEVLENDWIRKTILEEMKDF